MLTTTFIFVVSFGGLLSMLISKWIALRSSVSLRPSFLGYFDAPLSRFLTRISHIFQKILSVSWFRTIAVFKAMGLAGMVYLHRLIEAAEQRTRAWREFARERKLQRKSASVFIKDVVAYKKELKENGNQTHP